MSSNGARLHRDGDALVFAGPLLGGAVAALWPQALAASDGARRLDLEAVERIDSAGLALLSALSERAGGDIAVTGRPAGLDELRAAYRLAPSLSFAGGPSPA